MLNLHLEEPKVTTTETPRDKARRAVALLQEAILELLAQRPGLTNAEIADALDIHSDYQGAQKDYLSWSVLGLLVNERRIRREGRRYYLADQ